MNLRRGERVRVLAPAAHRDREGTVEVPVWTESEGSRRIGVRLDTGEMVWATAVEVTGRRRVTTK